MKNYKMEGVQMKEPLVSIIMGVYNEEKNVSKCIESILNQSYENWELIICDDCSKDRTKEIIDNYSIIDNRIIVISNEKNLRLAASLNRCLKKARGKYIARMDADDECIPDRILIQVEFLENNKDIDCVGCNRIVFDDDGDIGIRTIDEIPKKETLLLTTPFAHPTIMMRKEVYDYLGGYRTSKETMRAEDLDLWFRFFANGFKGYNIQKCLYRYHESENDIKKRNIKAAIGTTKVFINGYKLLGFPLYKYPFALKPIITSLLPNRFVKKYHKRKDENNAII